MIELFMLPSLSFYASIFMILMYALEGVAIIYLLRAIIWAKTLEEKIDLWMVALLAALASVMFHILFWIEVRLV